MHARILMRTTAGKMGVVAIATILAAGAAMAGFVGIALPDTGVDNPGSLPLTQTREGVQNAVSLLASHAAQAANTNGSAWFHAPSVFSEYTYTDSRDKRLGGYTSHMRDAVAGLNFLTIGDVAVSFAGRYDHTAAAAHLFNTLDSDNADNYGLTLTAAKNFDWFLMGASASYNGGDSQIRTPIDEVSHITVDSAGTTLAPFVGAMYVNGNLALATIPTYLFYWNWQDYDSTIWHSPSDDHVSQDTFVWVNTASYSVSDKLTVGLEADWNRVTHTKKASSLREEEIRRFPTGDREWVTAGPNVTYHLTPALAVYASCTKALAPARLPPCRPRWARVTASDPGRMPQPAQAVGGSCPPAAFRLAGAFLSSSPRG